jgi:hypothetical protein
MDEKEMLGFVKAIADMDRLRIVGLLTQKPARLSEICETLGYHPTDAQHHLDQLLQNGIVSQEAGLYGLNAEGLEKLSRRQFEGERQVYSPQPDLEKNRRRVLAAHLNPDGTVKQVPLQAAKLQILLDYLIGAFTVGENYTEKEVNLILAHFHPDTAGLRRDLIEAGMLERKRDGSQYWRPE